VTVGVVGPAGPPTVSGSGAGAIGSLTGSSTAGEGAGAGSAGSAGSATGAAFFVLFRAGFGFAGAASAAGTASAGGAAAAGGSAAAEGSKRPRCSVAAFRRTRSAWASTMLEEWVFTPMPSAKARSIVSLLERPSSLASS
jgi:hypothetical protein